MLLVLLGLIASSAVAQQERQTIELWGSSPNNTLTNYTGQDYFNILAIDGGGIRGLIPLPVVKFLENETYAYAVEQGYIQAKNASEPQKLYMPQFFDIMAGTSIGGLISSILTVPSPDKPGAVAYPKYSSADAIEVMGDEGDYIFTKDHMSTWAKVFWCIAIFALGSALAYCLGVKCLTNKHYEEQMKQIQAHISQTNQLNGKSKVDEQESTGAEKLMSQLKVALIAKVRLEGDPELNKKLEENSEVAIVEARYMLLNRQKEYNSRKKYVWIIFGLGSLVSLLIGIFVPPYIWYGYTTSLYGRQRLDNVLTSLFGDLRLDQSLSELTLVSYEYISQTARIYSKWSYQQDPNVYNISYVDATGATSAAPFYFDPKTRYTMDGTLEYLIDGGVIANNPSVYAEQVAAVNKNNLPVRLISIGTGAYNATNFTRGEYGLDYDDFTIADWWELSASFLCTSISQKNSNVVAEIQADNYVRIQTVSSIALDDAAQAHELLEEGEKMVRENIDILTQLAHILVEQNRYVLPKQLAQ